MKYTKRTRIFTGTACNVKCRFCYYYLSEKHNFWSKKDIFKELDIAKSAGMKAVDFSGGEPTIHPDFIEIIKHAKDLGFGTICTLTNGSKMYKKDFTESIVKAGINDVLFSVHGYNPKEHDYITQVEGSFDKLIESIKNLKEFDIPFRINCTVSNINYKTLEKHAELYNELEPLQVNFILFNDFETAAGLSDKVSIRYSEATPYIKKAIDMMKDKVKYINVRYIPFCFMKGYEKHVTDYPQKIYDPFEWSQRLLIRFPATGIKSFWRYSAFLAYSILKTRPKLKFSSDFFEDACVNVRMSKYVKSEACKKCKYDKICQGLEKSYIDLFGSSELESIEGEKIKNPLHFREDFYSGFSYDS
ncbi:MAG: radical SAM protein [Promethearchaeota archaeon]